VICVVTAKECVQLRCEIFGASNDEKDPANTDHYVNFISNAVQCTFSSTSKMSNATVVFRLCSYMRSRLLLW
jgi:hypothetical protein